MSRRGRALSELGSALLGLALLAFALWVAPEIRSGEPEGAPIVESLKRPTDVRPIASYTLRASLDVEDQELLMLRVDRSLPWDALVVVLRGEDEAPLSADEQKRQTARLRKRFQLLKDKLRELARREGLLDLEDDG